MDQAREQLHKTWLEKKDLYDQVYDLNIFLRDAELLDRISATQEVKHLLSCAKMYKYSSPLSKGECILIHFVYSNISTLLFDYMNCMFKSQSVSNWFFMLFLVVERVLGK